MRISDYQVDGPKLVCASLLTGIGVSVALYGALGTRRASNLAVSLPTATIAGALLSLRKVSLATLISKLESDKTVFWKIEGVDVTASLLSRAVAKASGGEECSGFVFVKEGEPALRVPVSDAAYRNQLWAVAKQLESHQPTYQLLQEIALLLCMDKVDEGASVLRATPLPQDTGPLTGNSLLLDLEKVTGGTDALTFWGVINQLRQLDARTVADSAASPGSTVTS